MTSVFETVYAWRQSTEAEVASAQSATTTTRQEMFNKWFDRDDAEGTVEEVQQTFSSIRSAVVGAWTIDTVTSSATWTRPWSDPLAITEFWVLLWGGGGKGEAGQISSGGTALALPAAGGGSHGGYFAYQFDPADIPSTVSVTVGAAATTAGTDGGVSSFGALASSVPGAAGIQTPQGFLSTSSNPGRGGDGGTAEFTSGLSWIAGDGEDGESTPLAANGVGGVGSNSVAAGVAAGTAGTAGSNADLTGLTKAGGAGGGGGGGRSAGTGSNIQGGPGGNGGYPGGGSGAGGAAKNSNFLGPVTAGVPGTPAAGLVIVMYRGIV